MCDIISEKEHQALRAKLVEWVNMEPRKIFGRGFFEFASENIFIFGVLNGFTKVNNKETILHFSNKDVGFVRYVVGEQQSDDDTTTMDSEKQETNLMTEEKQQTHDEQQEEDSTSEDTDEDPRVSKLLTEIQAIDYLAKNDNDQKFLALVLLEWQSAPLPYTPKEKGWEQPYQTSRRDCSERFIPFIQRARNMNELRDRIERWRTNEHFDFLANEPYINGILSRAFEKLKK